MGVNSGPVALFRQHECQDFELAISVSPDGRSKVNRGAVPLATAPRALPRALAR
jgi:hypothetical protein